MDQKWSQTGFATAVLLLQTQSLVWFTTEYRSRILAASDGAKASAEHADTPETDVTANACSLHLLPCSSHVTNLH